MRLTTTDTLIVEFKLVILLTMSTATQIPRTLTLLIVHRLSLLMPSPNVWTKERTIHNVTTIPKLTFLMHIHVSSLQKKRQSHTKPLYRLWLPTAYVQPNTTLT